MNNKGFTLLELLAVIALLGLIIGIVVPSGLKIKENGEKKLLNTKVKNLEKAAIIYAQNNSLSYSVSNCKTGYSSKKIQVNDLLVSKTINPDEGNDVINPVNKKSMKNCYICIYEKYNRIYAEYSKTTTDDKCWVK